MDYYSRTYQTNPELWDEGFSFLAKLLYADGTQGVVASGWHLREIKFEDRITFDEQPDGCGFISIGAPQRDYASCWDGVEKYEFEISLDGTSDEMAASALAHCMPQGTAKKIIESVGHMNKRVSANRSDSPISAPDGSVIDTIDLLCQNFPARSGDTSEPLRQLSRWCRLFSMPNGTVTVYQPLDDDGRANLRWPHNCIWLNRGAAYYEEPSADVGSLAEAFEIPLKYEDYNLENWRVEFEFWENEPFQIMVSEDSEVATSKLASAQTELSVLSQFVSTAFLSARNLERRMENNALLAGDPELRKIAERHLKWQKGKVKEYRDLLRHASTMLANTAQSVQAIANQENAEASERTNAFLTYATAVFFIPTLIISFYSMQIIGMSSDDVVPTTKFVFTLCLASVIVALAVIVVVRLARKRSKRRK